VLFKGFLFENIYLTDVTIDGLDSTDSIYSLIKNVTFDFLFLSGITFAGFNVVDVKTLNKLLDKPIIVIITEKPRNFAIKNALKQHFQDWIKRWGLIEALKPIYPLQTNKNYKPIYFEIEGMDFKNASKLLLSCTVQGRIPEPIRVANILAKELTSDTREMLNFQLENDAF
jgi:endonuclease V-like protein UPF0215 family